MSGLPSKDEHLSGDRLFGLAVLAACLGALAVGVCLRFGYTIDDSYLPAWPARPAEGDERAFKSTDFTPQMYEAYLTRDCEQVYKIPRVSADDIASPFPYQRIEQQRWLAPGDPPIETQALRLSVQVQKLQAMEAGGTYAADHLVLTIENKLASHVAYRVATSVDAGTQLCLRKADLPHDAVAIAPNGKVARTECLVRGPAKVRVDLIETMIVPELSYYYISRLVPTHIGLDLRSTRGHRPPLSEACATIPEQAIRMALDKKQATWRDIIDFYARHRCDTYLFAPGYRAFSRKGEWTLPYAGAAP